jgi:hypothetical protein
MGDETFAFINRTFVPSESPVKPIRTVLSGVVEKEKGRKKHGVSGTPLEC